MWGTDTPVKVLRCAEHGLRHEYVEGGKRGCDVCDAVAEVVELVSADWLERCEQNVRRAQEAERREANLLRAVADVDRAVSVCEQRERESREASVRGMEPMQPFWRARE